LARELDGKKTLVLGKPQEQGMIRGGGGEVGGFCEGTICLLLIGDGLYLCHLFSALALKDSYAVGKKVGLKKCRYPAALGRPGQAATASWKGKSGEQATGGDFYQETVEAFLMGNSPGKEGGSGTIRGPG
jgi:hypothetical protein